MSETKFLTNTTTPNYSNNKGIDINSINDYVFLSHAFEGCGGFKDGSYLYPFPREGYYDNRKAMSAYRNYVKPIINSMITPVYNNTIERESNSNLFNSFLENVDNSQTPININSKDVVTYARLHGTTFVVMDNFESTPEVTQDAIDQRKFPYIYTQPAYLVYKYSQDIFGNLVNITFVNEEERDGNMVKVYVTWDSNTKVVEVKDGDKVKSTETFIHGLGVTPVIRVSSVNVKDILPRPPFYDVAKTNYIIFNKDSEIRDQERSQAFSILYYQTETNNNNMTVGPNNAIILPATPDINITPGFIGPDPAIVTMLVDNNEKLVDSLYKLAESEGIIGVQKANSGIAASYSFISKRTLLEQTAKIAVKYEQDLSVLFGKYVNETIKYEVTYPSKYSPTITSDFTTLKDMLSLEMSEEVNIEIKRAMVSDIFNHMSDEELIVLKETLNGKTTKVITNTVGE